MSQELGSTIKPIEGEVRPMSEFEKLGGVRPVSQEDVSVPDSIDTPVIDNSADADVIAPEDIEIDDNPFAEHDDIVSKSAAQETTSQEPDADSEPVLQERDKPETPITPILRQTNERNETPKNRNKVIAAIGAVALFAGGMLWADRDNNVGAREPNPITTPSNEAVNGDLICEDTWAVEEADHGDNNRWYGQGLRAIEEADTKVEAEAATALWLDRVKTDPQLLAGAGSSILEKPITDTDLYDQDGCMTEQGEQVTAELATYFARSAVKPDVAPADGINTGTDAVGNVTQAAEPGITGDRTAVKVTGPDGKVFWIMARCGNPVFEKEPDLPEGPTDNKVIFELPGDDGTAAGDARTQPGSGGTPEEEMDPEKDSDDNGYGPGDTKPPTPTPDSTRSPQPTEAPTPRPTQTATVNPTNSPNPSTTPSEPV